MKAFVFLAKGFEEIEAITPVDILKRAGIEVETISISNSKEVVGAHGIVVVADYIFDDADLTDADLIFLPGGMPGTTNLDAHEGVKALVQQQLYDQKLLAAICAAPLIIGKMGFLKGKEAICYPGFENLLEGATISKHNVVKDGNIITGKGAGVAVQFALKLVEELKGKDIADKVANEICV